jgi:hypothetical protein
MRIIDHTQNRLLLSRLGEKTENCEPDEKRVRRLSCGESERDAEWVSLRIRQPVAVLEERRAELLQCRVVKLHLRFDPRCPDDAEVLRRTGGVLEQRGFAHPWIAVNDEDGPVAFPRCTQQALDDRDLALSTEQPPALYAFDHATNLSPRRLT